MTQIVNGMIAVKSLRSVEYELCNSICLTYVDMLQYVDVVSV